MMAAVRPVKQWGHTEARLLQICLSQSEDIPQIQERFEAVSSCSPELVESLLGQSLALRPDQDLPATPDDQMLRWLANLCPYSEAAAHQLIGHVADRYLHENDWSALLALAKECHSLDLGWLKNIAEAVLADKHESGGVVSWTSGTR
jgi:S-formylglutathione hydrolase FrmB